MKRLTFCLLLLLPFLIAAKPIPAFCYVRPNPTAPNTQFTVEAFAPSNYSLYIQEPSPGPLSIFEGFSGNSVLYWATPYSGFVIVQIMTPRTNNPRVLASCSTTVLP